MWLILDHGKEFSGVLRRSRAEIAIPQGLIHMFTWRGLSSEPGLAALDRFDIAAALGGVFNDDYPAAR